MNGEALPFRRYAAQPIEIDPEETQVSDASFATQFRHQDKARMTGKSTQKLSNEHVDTVVKLALRQIQCLIFSATFKHRRDDHELKNLETHGPCGHFADLSVLPRPTGSRAEQLPASQGHIR